MKPQRVITLEQLEAFGFQTRLRPINIYPTDPGLRSKEEKWGVPKMARQLRVPRKLLLLGTGRSGTMFSTRALKELGLDLGHEKVGPDGVVSHYFLLDSDWYPMAPWQHKQGKKHVGERRSDYKFDNVMLIVRDPRKAIPSMTKIFGSVTWQFYIDNGILPGVIKDPVLRAMTYWHNYNLCAKAQSSFWFQLERYRESWPAICSQLEVEPVPYPAHLKPMNKTGGFKSYEPITFDDMLRRDEALARRIAKLAAEFGYYIHKPLNTQRRGVR